ncbi:hypothetical protein SELMODRAFT_406966 [Selaginella moellendorffii]|uniref:Peptidase A1 domain-containing protein n=1 Tax=Selaginella moellendorffii TaxID=88036 RepID=D8R3H7_SELML|nr:hypothetical protein SELMODRAFT_406966 [Selaginella moellendorffii]
MRIVLLLVSSILIAAASRSNDRVLRDLAKEEQQRFLPGIKLGMSRLDKWGSFHSFSSLTQSFLDELLHEVVTHDFARARALASRLVSSNSPNRSSSDHRHLAEEEEVEHDLAQTPVSFTNGGVYYSSITLGSPPKDFSLVMDTGSDLTWVRCDPCSPDCSSTFDRLASNTYKALTCADDLRLPVLLRLWRRLFHSGRSLRDTLKMAGAASDELEEFPGFVFGCGSLLKGLISGEVGILALSPGSLSFPSQIGEKYGNKFSYCLLRQTAQNSLKKSPMVFGEAAVELKEPGSGKPQELQYTPIGESSIYYTVRLDGISVGNQRLDLSPSTFLNGQDKPTIFDSGTTLTMLPSGVCDSIKQSLASMVSGAEFVAIKGLDACFRVPPSSGQGLPDITFHFNGGADFVTRPSNYVIDLGSLQCLIFVPTNEVSIFGNLQQQDFFVLHDMDNRRIGFKETDCGAHSLRA